MKPKKVAPVPSTEERGLKLGEDMAALVKTLAPRSLEAFIEQARAMDRLARSVEKLNLHLEDLIDKTFPKGPF